MQKKLTRREPFAIMSAAGSAATSELVTPSGSPSSGYTANVQINVTV